MAAHTHAENMMLYAQDAAEIEKPWERWETAYKGESPWRPLKVNPGWLTQSQYRRIPTTCEVNGIEVPMPVRGPLEPGTKYWVSEPSSPRWVICTTYNGDEADRLWLERGLIHLSREDALAHAKAMVFISEDRGNEERG